MSSDPLLSIRTVLSRGEVRCREWAVLAGLRAAAAKKTSANDGRFHALEIGCMFKNNEGISTYTIANFLHDLPLAQRRLVSMDIDPTHLHKARLMLEGEFAHLLPLIDFVQGNSVEAIAPALEKLGPVDFAFLDGGGHPGVCLYECEQVLHHLTPDGVIVIDDLHEMATTEHFRSGRFFGKGTLILPLMILGEYLGSRYVNGAPSALLAACAPRPFAEVLSGLDFMFGSASKHRLLFVGREPSLQRVADYWRKEKPSNFQLTNLPPEALESPPVA